MTLEPVIGGLVDFDVLYRLLAERTPEQSISHKEMPTWEAHCAFVRAQPYDAWYLICDGGESVGSIYLTNRSEIGIFIFKKHQRKGYARDAVQELMRLHPGKFLANVNPANEASIKFFRGLGFKHIQNTYAR